MDRRGVKLLLDTHVLIWWWSRGGGKLPERIREMIVDPSNQIIVSAVCAWEIATKVRLGKLAEAADAVENFFGWLVRDGFDALSVTVEHGLRAGSFAAQHGDPFDRMLAAQSIIADAPIISRDTQLDSFGCERIWA